LDSSRIIAHKYFDFLKQRKMLAKITVKSIQMLTENIGMTERKNKKTKSSDLQAQLESWVHQCDAIHAASEALKASIDSETNPSRKP
jgi:hypothetical protein